MMKLCSGLVVKNVEGIIKRKGKCRLLIKLPKPIVTNHVRWPSSEVYFLLTTCDLLILF
jgi:hypothetical protein